jgi:hypothetical protein
MLSGVRGFGEAVNGCHARWLRVRDVDADADADARHGAKKEAWALHAAACLDHRGGTSTRHKTTAGRYLQPHTMIALSC